MRMPGKAGFTLSELLIIFSVIGIIAAFSLPRVLEASRSYARDAIIREALATLWSVQQQGMLTQQLQTTNFTTYFLNRMNATSVCTVNAAAQGCWDIAVQGVGGGYYTSSSESSQPGVVLPNGAILVGFDAYGIDPTPPFWNNSIYLDWNGKAGPNKLGEDQLWVDLCFGSQSCLIAADHAPGTIVPTQKPAIISPSDAIKNRQLFEDVFTQ